MCISVTPHVARACRSASAMIALPSPPPWSAGLTANIPK